MCRRGEAWARSRRARRPSRPQAVQKPWVWQPHLLRHYRRRPQPPGRPGSVRRPQVLANRRKPAQPCLRFRRLQWSGTVWPGQRRYRMLAQARPYQRLQEPRNRRRLRWPSPCRPCRQRPSRPCPRCHLRPRSRYRYSRPLRHHPRLQSRALDRPRHPLPAGGHRHLHHALGSVRCLQDRRRRLREPLQVRPSADRLRLLPDHPQRRLGLQLQPRGRPNRPNCDTHTKETTRAQTQ